MNIIKILTLNNLFRYKLILIAVVITAVLLTACNNKITDPPPDEEPLPIPKDSINLVIEDVTHRSITLNLSAIIKNPKTKSLKLFREFNGTKNILTELYDTTVDTSIIDDNNGEGLLLDTVYTYYAITTDSTGAEIDTSKKITGRTLAPTSHNYIWEEITIGDGQSYLTDVWGTDENNVYAVGSVRINNEVYGVIKWNGNEWLPEKRYGGLNAIFGFSSSDIWAVGGSVYHYNGSEWKELIYQDSVLLSNITYTSLWGTSSSNMYFGTARGKIIHWDGSKAREVKIFGDIAISDISGIKNFGFYAVGFRNSDANNVIAFYDFNEWHNINNSNLINNYPRTVKMFARDYTLIGGNTLYMYNGNDWTRVLWNNTGTIRSINGDKTNNIFAVGFYKEVFHFNGVNWHLYEQLKTQSQVCHGVYSTGNKVFVVGENHSLGSAFILIGTL